MSIVLRTLHRRRASPLTSRSRPSRSAADRLGRRARRPEPDTTKKPRRRVARLSGSGAESRARRARRGGRAERLDDEHSVAARHACTWASRCRAKRMIELVKNVAESNGLKVTQTPTLIQISGPAPEPAQRQTPAADPRAATAAAEPGSSRCGSSRIGCKHASAVQLAPVLTNLFSGFVGNRRGGRGNDDHSRTRTAASRHRGQRPGQPPGDITGPPQQSRRFSRRSANSQAARPRWQAGPRRRPGGRGNRRQRAREPLGDSVFNR